MFINTPEATEYRRKFHKYYYSNIIPQLTLFEEERKKTLLKYNIVLSVAFIFVIILILLMLYNTSKMGDGISAFFFGIPLFAIPFRVSYSIKKKFENNVKQKIMTPFLNFFGNFIWTNKKSLPPAEIKNSLLISRFDLLRSDDYFEGTYEGIKIIISENELIQIHHNSKGGTRHITIFDGLFIKIDMNKNFKYHTIIKNEKLFNAPFNKNFEKVELEDPEFNKMFDVYSQDQIEARYLITTSFMERFKNLQEVYNTKKISASFLENSILISMDCRKDMFKLNKLEKPLDNGEEFQTLFEEFVAIISLVDLLKLDQKIGL
jgi:hypothetical protein